MFDLAIHGPLLYVHFYSNYSWQVQCLYLTLKKFALSKSKTNFIYYSYVELCEKLHQRTEEY